MFLFVGDVRENRIGIQSLTSVMGSVNEIMSVAQALGLYAFVELAPIAGINEEAAFMELLLVRS